jgi:hypothetical protein
MAMAPWHERARLLYAAIDKASFSLKRSIDRVELTGNQILFRAGRKKLAIAYRYVGDDSKIPGSASFHLDGEYYERPEVPKGRPSWYVRSILLYAAIRRATFDLNEPVDRVEVTAGRLLSLLPHTGEVRCWAGAKQQTMGYRYVAERGLFGPRRLFLDDEEIVD